ncbi:MAG: hypothetical protein Q8M83_01315 [bacterium]|nr:hypothetical protein [bacterium]
MFKIYVHVCAVVILSLFLATFGAEGAKSSESDAKERAKIKAEWFKSAKEVAHKINDKEANEIFQFLENNAILAAPNERGVQFLEAGKDNNWIAIIPLLKKDRDVSELWEKVFATNAAAHFLPKARSVVIKSYIPYSMTGRAIIFLHEGYHAYTFVKNPREEEQSVREYCYEEVRAHTFQNKVMSLLGGKKYQEILDKEIVRIAADAKKCGGKIGDKIISRAEYDERIASAFGQPASQTEKDYIQTSIWVHAVFTFLDKEFKGDVEDQKALFLKTLYEKMGIR